MRILAAASCLVAACLLTGCGDVPPETHFRSDRWHFQISVPSSWKQAPVKEPPPALGKRDNFGWRRAVPVVGFSSGGNAVMSVYAVTATTANGYPLEGLMGQRAGRTTVDVEPGRPPFSRELINGREAFTVDEAATFGAATVPRIVFMDFGQYVYAFVLRDEAARGQFDDVTRSIEFFNKVSRAGRKVEGA